MSTGFGYVRDSKPNIIDWADIGKKMSDSLELEIKDRQKRKDDINANLGEFSSQLLDQPQGAYAEANRFFADFSQQASQQALRDLQDLKSGRLSEQEYYQRRANLQSGTDLMFKAGKLFNDNYSQAMQRIQDGSASVLEADLKAKMEGYLNFAKSGAYINPLTGTVNVSILDNNGNVSSKRGDFMDASELVKLSSETFDNFKLDETIKNITDRLGNITYRTPDGKTIKVSTIDFDLLDKKDQAKFKNKFNSAIDSEVDAIVGGINSKAAASILADHSGESYSLAFDINNTDENKIIFDPNGNVQLTESQLNKAKEIVRNKLRSQIDVSILERIPESMTPSQINRRDKLDANVRLGKFVRDALAAPDAASLSENLEVIQEFNPKITSIRKTGENSIVYSIVNDQGKVVKKTITLSDDIKNSVEKALQQLLGPKTNVSEIVKRIDFDNYQISDIEGLYAPQEIKEIKSIDDPLNFLTSIEGGSQKFKKVSDVIENITEVNEEKAKDIKEILLNQQFKGAEVEVYQESVPRRGGQGGRGRRTNRGFLITIPSLNIELRVPSTTENIQDVIKKILSDATELVKTANQQLETVQPKKVTPLSK
tara:strand:+ start:606 stop:2399 length:1794 start_codon:yes stop_codon:yes gene_type:complete